MFKINPISIVDSMMSRSCSYSSSLIPPRVIYSFIVVVVVVVVIIVITIVIIIIIRFSGLGINGDFFSHSWGSQGSSYRNDVENNDDLCNL